MLFLKKLFYACCLFLFIACNENSPEAQSDLQSTSSLFKIDITFSSDSEESTKATLYRVTDNRETLVTSFERMRKVYGRSIGLPSDLVWELGSAVDHVLEITHPTRLARDYKVVLTDVKGIQLPYAFKCQPKENGLICIQSGRLPHIYR